MALDIPQRASNDADFPQLKKIEKQIVVAAVLLQLGNQDAYLLYHPEYLKADGKINDTGKQKSSMFWSYGKIREYRTAYERTLSKAFGVEIENTELSDKEKESLKKKFTGKVYRALGTAEGIEQLKDAADLGKTAKIFKEDDSSQEAPRRYLPRHCEECSYKQFIDENVKLGNIREIKET